MIAGNWKMNGLTADGVNLAKEVALAVKAKKRNCEFVVCPPFTLLNLVKKALRGSKVALGAQDCHTQEKGAHTGDVSPVMIKDLGCEYVILGHSERRADHKESSALVKAKAESAHLAGLKTIICIGETLTQREEGKTVEVCSKQVRESLPDDAKAANTVIAYEPVWAIGTGKTATSEQAEETIKFIRGVIAKMYTRKIANKVRIQYGGSMNPKNVKELMAMPNIDGGLIGGASLKAEDFSLVVNFDK